MWPTVLPVFMDVAMDAKLYPPATRAGVEAALVLPFPSLPPPFAPAGEEHDGGLESAN